MTMAGQKLWQEGAADEPWKVLVCALDAKRAEDAVDFLSYVLTDAGSDRKQALARLRDMTGAQIVSGLLAYRDSAYRSVKNALPSDAATLTSAERGGA